MDKIEISEKDSELIRDRISNLVMEVINSGFRVMAEQSRNAYSGSPQREEFLDADRIFSGFPGGYQTRR